MAVNSFDGFKVRDVVRNVKTGEEYEATSRPAAWWVHLSCGHEFRGEGAMPKVYATRCPTCSGD